MGDQCSVWFNAVVRGDVNSARIGNRVNIQDGALHCTFEKTKLIGDNVSIGHNALVHGCDIGILMGMGAIVMDNCQASNCIVAGAFFEGTNGVLEYICRVPAKKSKKFIALFDGEIKRISNNRKYSGWLRINIVNLYQSIK